jgi:hypothetical protein
VLNEEALADETNGRRPYVFGPANCTIRVLVDQFEIVSIGIGFVATKQTESAVAQKRVIVVSGAPQARLR